MLEIQDHYFHLAKKDGYVARSAYKLQEIDEKFKFFWRDVCSVIDIGCAPWSWLQYTSRKLAKNNNPDSQLIWFDLKKVEINLPYTATFVQDITEQDQVKTILYDQLWDSQVDVIISDMAPDTVGNKWTDALRSCALIMDTMWMYETLLKKDGKFTIKVFMWPWFEDLVQYCRNRRWAAHIKIFKPKACRKESKETYIVKI
jgi:23S rRNA (uridine2552-2'-O)-methyltransferase